MTRIRVATNEDAERIGVIHDAAVHAFGPDAYDDDQVAAWRDADEADANGGEGDSDAGDETQATPEDDDHWIVAERDGTVVGWGRIDADAAEITGSYVHPDVARSGVGSTIIAALEEYARGQGLGEVTLAASKNAVAFYERLGYEAVGEVEHGTDAVVIECLEMHKSL